MLEGIIDANMANRSRARTSSPMNGSCRRRPSEFTLRDVIGCEVFLTDDTHRRDRRRHRNRRPTTSSWCGDEGKEVLVPVMRGCGQEIDVASKRVVIEAIPGLLE